MNAFIRISHAPGIELRLANAELGIIVVYYDLCSCRHLVIHVSN